MCKKLHIISFNIPFPPNYGGIIDVYHKIRALHAQGIKIILHCFEYERPRAQELESICEKVYYYKRQTGWKTNFSFLPYNVNSRRSKELLKNLLLDEYPILFETLHTCYLLKEPSLKDRFKIYRESNIEHDYYRELGKATRETWKKCFMYVEAFRYKRYEKVLRHADLILAISTADQDYLQMKFPDQRIEFMPGFHANDQISILPGQSDFLLYHGKLSVAENERAALFLIRYVFSKLNHTCIIAGMDPSKRLLEAASIHPNIHIEANTSAERMNYLIQNAQIQVLITFQDTGLKLKLMNSLFGGRHTVVNSMMLTGSGLDDLCVVADTPEDMIRVCNELMELPVTEELIGFRKNKLFPTYSNLWQAKRLDSMLPDDETDTIQNIISM